MDDEQQPWPQDWTGPAEAASRDYMHNQGRLVEPMTAFNELDKLTLGPQSLTTVLQRVAELAQAVIPDTREASVTLMNNNENPETVVFTGPLALQLDELQYEVGFGPCMDAAVTGRIISLANADPDSPYPEFSRAALRSGVSHILSVGMPTPHRIVGALNLYAAGIWHSTTRPFS